MTINWENYNPFKWHSYEEAPKKQVSASPPGRFAKFTAADGRVLFVNDVTPDEIIAAGKRREELDKELAGLTDADIREAERQKALLHPEIADKEAAENAKKYQEEQRKKDEEARKAYLAQHH